MGIAGAKLWWDRISAVLVLISLADLTKQLVQWAKWIHWLVAQYAEAKAKIFGWLPFHISEQYRTPILLALIVLSVASAGYYERTRRYLVIDVGLYVAAVFASFAYWLMALLPLRSPTSLDRRERFSDRLDKFTSDVQRKIGFGRLTNVVIGHSRSAYEQTTRVAIAWSLFLCGTIGTRLAMAFRVQSLVWFVAILLGIFAAFGLGLAAFIARRWILAVGVGFAALLGINEIYVRLLA